MTILAYFILTFWSLVALKLVFGEDFDLAIISLTALAIPVVSIMYAFSILLK